MKRDGFSLVEVLFALALFGIAAAVFSTAFVNTMKAMEAMSRVQHEETSFRFLRSQILQEADLDVIEQGGIITLYDDRVATWSVELEPTTVIDVIEVYLVIEIPPLNDGDEDTVYRDLLRVTRPTWTDPVERSETLAEATDEVMEWRLSQGW